METGLCQVAPQALWFTLTSSGWFTRPRDPGSAGQGATGQNRPLVCYHPPSLPPPSLHILYEASLGVTCVSSSLMLLHCWRCHWWCGLWAILGNAPEWLAWHHHTHSSTHTHEHTHISAAGCLRNKLLIIRHRSEVVCSKKVNNGWWGGLNPVCPPVHKCGEGVLGALIIQLIFYLAVV